VNRIPEAVELGGAARYSRREGPATSRLDEEKLALLRRWGDGLTLDEREEMRAAGRAILMLSDEIERLHIDLWHARDGTAVNVEEAVAAQEEEEEPSAAAEPAADLGLGATLRNRLAALRLSNR
jgi:hypothetical protein